MNCTVGRPFQVRTGFSIRILNFGFVSDFDIRISDFSMPPYPIYCYTRGCPNLAVYKIAARWSDGVIGELKTYALCCAACLADGYRQSRAKQAACRLTSRETLEPPGIYRLERGLRDQKLQRLPELEEPLTPHPSAEE